MSAALLRLAIVGGGPRTLAALEALLRRRKPGQRLAVTLFAPDPHPGAGPNFVPGQSPLCLLNIPLRGIDLPASPVGFPAFHDWLEPEARHADHYPSRADFGAWASARLGAVLGALPEEVTVRVVARRVHTLRRNGPEWRVSGQRFDAVLLVPGQPATRPDDQFANWQRHARRGVAELCPAYPANALLAHSKGWQGQTIAIRGLGLATLDVIRLLTLGAGGRIDGGTYHPSGEEPRRILPFSRDGLPPWPKPATASLDEQFTLTKPEAEAFSAALNRAMEGTKKRSLPTICETMVPPALRILRLLGAQDREIAVSDWLDKECKAPAGQEQRDGAAVLAQGLAMASGERPPDAGYVIGQIWRKLQPLFRAGFNLHQPAGPVAESLIGFDEGLKRYSYGPPPLALRELQVLITAGLVSLRVADDPDIGMVRSGWRLTESGAHIDATVLIDAVLPAPRLVTLRDPVFVALVRAGYLSELPETGGVQTDPAGRAMDPSGQPVRGLSLLGRLAIGSVAAADSIHDCFGEGTDRWAAQLLDDHV